MSVRPFDRCVFERDTRAAIAAVAIALGLVILLGYGLRAVTPTPAPVAPEASLSVTFERLPRVQAEPDPLPELRVEPK